MKISEVFFRFFVFVLETLILKIYFLIIKINIFRGDLSDISAKTATLVKIKTAERLGVL